MDIDSARRRGLRRRLAVLLLALVAALSVTAHHELMAMGAMGDTTVALGHVAPTTPGMTPGMTSGVASGMTPATPAVHAAVRPTADAHAAVHGDCAGGTQMCTAAGVAGQPLPAALPQRAIPDVASPALAGSGRVPSGAGPPAPAGTTSVLRI